MGSTSDSSVCPHPAALPPEPGHEQGRGWMRAMASSPSIFTTTHRITPLDETHLTDANTELQWQEVICPGSRSDGHASSAAAPDAAGDGGGELGGGSGDSLCAASRCPGGHSLLLEPRGPAWDPERTPDGSAPADPRASSRFGSLSGTREVKVGSMSPALPPAQGFREAEREVRAYAGRSRQERPGLVISHLRCSPRPVTNAL